MLQTVRPACKQQQQQQQQGLLRKGALENDWLPCRPSATADRPPGKPHNSSSTGMQKGPTFLKGVQCKKQSVNSIVCEQHSMSSTE
eukprot:270285-Pelagomonas_calceolata.AAC.5